MSQRTSLGPHELADRLRAARSAVALTGAGISTAAGIPDFRGPEGLYATRRYDPDTVFDIGAFRRNPDPFYAFSREMLEIVDTLAPTFAHRFLAALERDGHLRAVLTQNIDPLHRMAGSRRLVPLHGDYATSRCLACGRTYDFPEFRAFLASAESPRCACGPDGFVKPDVVFFGEAVSRMGEAESLAREADLMLVLGSSLVVYPAALLPQVVAGEVVVVSQGESGLPPGPDRYFVDADLDDYFRAVADEMHLAVGG